MAVIRLALSLLLFACCVLAQQDDIVLLIKVHECCVQGSRKCEWDFCQSNQDLEARLELQVNQEEWSPEGELASQLSAEGESLFNTFGGPDSPEDQAAMLAQRDKYFAISAPKGYTSSNTKTVLLQTNSSLARLARRSGHRRHHHRWGRVGREHGKNPKLSSLLSMDKKAQLQQESSMLSMNLWPGGLIPFTPSPLPTDPAPDSAFVTAFAAGVSEYASRTCISFISMKELDDEIGHDWKEDFSMLVLREDPKAQFPGTSAIGKDEMVILTLTKKSKTLKYALHEMGHVIGLRHEHQRKDREGYVVIDDQACSKWATEKCTERVTSLLKGGAQDPNFQPALTACVATYLDQYAIDDKDTDPRLKNVDGVQENNNFDYDANSIMHYAFIGNPCMQQGPKWPAGARPYETLSTGDALVLNSLYQCLYVTLFHGPNQLQVNLGQYAPISLVKWRVQRATAMPYKDMSIIQVWDGKPFDILTLPWIQVALGEGSSGKSKQQKQAAQDGTAALRVYSKEECTECQGIVNAWLRGDKSNTFCGATKVGGFFGRPSCANMREKLKLIVADSEGKGSAQKLKSWMTQQSQNGAQQITQVLNWLDTNKNDVGAALDKSDTPKSSICQTIRYCMPTK